MYWEVQPKRVRAPYAKRSEAGRIQSSVGHEESGVKPGGPPPKPKYYLMTDSEQVP